MLKMHKTDNPKKTEIDFSQLWDLRVDFAFKLLFTKGDPRLLISLLNAIFANKKIQRVIKSLKIINPNIEKEEIDDKYSILDIKAELDNKTFVLIEMQMYSLGELKAKTIRSCARIHGGKLKKSERYKPQPPTISIAFTNGTVQSATPDEEEEKIHRLCMIMDCEDHTVFSEAMEFHYIDMRAFAKAVNEAGTINIGSDTETMFASWLSLITEKEIKDKKILNEICKEAEEIQMAASTLAVQSKDKNARLTYARREDEVYFHKKEKHDLEQKIAQALRREAQEKTRAEQEKTRAEQAEAEIKRLHQLITELQPKN
jgi:predicted transposase/invertase (TIGR01784 family)